MEFVKQFWKGFGLFYSHVDCRLYFSASISIGQADKNKLDAQQLLETYLENFSHSLKNDLILRILLTFEEKNLEYDSLL